jgi:phospholipid/cholesterol/gamma-HCH transport system substrate-binding protein
VLLAMVTLAGCSIRTIGGPTGHTTLYATFDDAQNLVAGHSVQMADIKVGSVTGVKLVSGYKARVSMSIKDGIKVPQGTTAEVAVTSLLGENFVRLTLPPGGSLSQGPYMADHAYFSQTSVQPQFEDIVGQAGTLIKAVAGNDVGTIVNTSATALGGNGEKLNSLVAKSSELIKIFASQREQLGTATQQFAKLSQSLAQGKDSLGAAPGQLAKTTKLLDDDKTKILSTISKLTDAAQQLNVKVLDGRVQRLRTLLRDLDPVLATFGGARGQLTDLVSGLAEFTQKLPKATYDGQLLVYPILKFMLPNGSLFPPVSSSTSKTATSSSTSSSSSTPTWQLPDALKNLLPKLGNLVGGGQ